MELCKNSQNKKEFDSIKWNFQWIHFYVILNTETGFFLSQKKFSHQFQEHFWNNKKKIHCIQKRFFWRWWQNKIKRQKKEKFIHEILTQLNSGSFTLQYLIDSRFNFPLNIFFMWRTSQNHCEWWQWVVFIKRT